MIPQTTQENSRYQTISLMVLAVVAATFSIYWLRPVLVPLVVALIVVSGLSPILKTLERRLGVSRIIAAGLTFLAGVGLLIVFGVSIWTSVVDLNQNAPEYRNRVEEIVNWVELRIDSVGAYFEKKTSSFLPESAINDGTSEVPTAITVDKPANDPSEFVDAFLRDGISVVSKEFISLLSTSVVVLIYVFFLLIGTSATPNASLTVREIDQQIRSYLALKTVISIFTGLAFGMALRLFGVPMAFTFGVLAFLLNFVPNVGPLVASVLPIPLILLSPDGSIGWMLAAIATTSAIQGISGNVVEPKVMGNSSDLHPVTILVALMFWGMMWGLIGMFLATPLTAALKIVLQRIDSTRPIADLMAGRFPAESET